MCPASPRPRVALSSGVRARLTPDVADAVDVVEITDDFDYASLDPSDIRFLAPGQDGPAVVPHLSGMRDLEVLQVASAGTDWVEPHVSAGVTLCNSRGARDAPVAEWVLGALLGASTHLLARAGAHSWESLELADLGEWTVLVVGMGSIGRKVAGYLAPLGTTVLGVASRARDDLHGIDELDDLLPRANAVVLLTPLTEQTEHLIGVEQFARLPDGAVVINAARGAVIDTDALVAALAQRRILAVLDVTDPEPLPDDHPLWSSPGILSITPHIAGASPAGHRAADQLAADQVGRWLAGEPLENVVARPSS